MYLKSHKVKELRKFHELQEQLELQDFKEMQELQELQELHICYHQKDFNKSRLMLNH